MLSLRKIATTFLVSAMVPFLAACSIQESKAAAEASANMYYETVATGNVDAVLGLYSDRFYEKTSKNKWRQILQYVHAKLGAYESHELLNWNVHHGVNTKYIGTITTLVYEVQYSKYDATERLVFMGSRSPKLIGHHINSQGLLAP